MNCNHYSEMNIFEEGLNNLGITLTDRQKQQFIDYYELLIEWNNVMNLTAITDLKEVIVKHFIDSLSLVKVYEPLSQKVLDMGTGAGFPGIPLKIAFPELDMILVDSLKKRITFLNEVINKLSLKNIITIHGRAEDLGHDILYREKFDLCVSRAVAKLSSLSEYCLPFVKRNGYFISYKSDKIEEELLQSKRAFEILGAEVESVAEFELPGSDMRRTMILIHKNKVTPHKYPRSAGKPTKEPL
ncbi:16S rRNA (guanine(527)-N(7))-methyltransferase RsmG [Lachnospiraceae bacterium MD1]|jgi:16S rRNA (guanine527-N7)-methyltransferase|uniref:Ribosomal RNA small subunit methyltransferase G n=1 Tax=Variimorphobacter saccharofermentans TaxID=2755051 RepID=A0A839K4B6_9FIRM|nr:16S rRNA (guanine(527)-N(7))-methyltransferase RsmG [Variimorphobacter saccharofermentans]MBB2184745.1 16S rRNA (guanine(527)-N(7))-methyltransferase RsmG [Variimorphobacter saccharofermentans]